MIYKRRSKHFDELKAKAIADDADGLRTSARLHRVNTIPKRGNGVGMFFPGC
jgi:hypothetical protein